MTCAPPPLDSAATLRETSLGVARLLDDPGLRDALLRAFAAASGEVDAIGAVLDALPTRPWTREQRGAFAASWKATHLKMLAIYGLSCRIQREALGAEGPAREQLLIAAAHNAASSYEDLGLDYDGVTHAALYEEFAAALVGDRSWRDEGNVVPEAAAFGAWVYRGMVVDPVEVGLMINILSEIYNHGEYTAALGSLARWFEGHTPMSATERDQALTYVAAHVQGETEVDHFLVVVRALREYCAAKGQALDLGLAEHVFTEYLRRLGAAFRALSARMLGAEHARS